MCFLTLTRNGSQFQTYVHRWAGGAGSPAFQAEDPREDSRKGFLDNIHLNAIGPQYVTKNQAKIYHFK